MAIDLKSAANLVERMQQIESMTLASVPLFILTDLFDGIATEDANSKTDIMNFVYQFRISNRRFEAIATEQLQQFSVFSAFSIKMQYHDAILTPKAFSDLPENRGKFGCLGIIKIDFLNHRYAVRLDEKLGELEKEKTYYTLDDMFRKPYELKLSEWCLDIFEEPSFRKRIQLVELYHHETKGSIWLSKKVFLPVRLCRWIHHFQNCFKIFFISPTTIARLADNLFRKQNYLRRINREAKQVNEDIANWKALHHTEICQQVRTVVNYLSSLGYTQADEKWWY